MREDGDWSILRNMLSINYLKNIRRSRNWYSGIITSNPEISLKNLRGETVDSSWKAKTVPCLAKQLAILLLWVLFFLPFTSQGKNLVILLLHPLLSETRAETPQGIREKVIDESLIWIRSGISSKLSVTHPYFFPTEYHNKVLVIPQ